MSKLTAITGNEAIAQAMRQINPEVVAAFPITPSTQIVENFAQFVADGIVKTELVTVESEHSAMSACIGASAAGGRVMTATASNGMALMWEMLYIAASLRLPILLSLVNRTLSGPINIHADHSDSMGARDSGWIQIYTENNQEAYDAMLMAPRIAEHADVRLPVMVCFDGFIISHCVQTMELEDDEQVRKFIGEYTPLYPLLDTSRPVTMGALDLQDYYIEHKHSQHVAMVKAKDVILSVSKEFKAAFGRGYELFESYRLEDAENVIVAINSVAGEIKEAVDNLRKRGIKAGLLKIRFFRPFPYEEIRDALKSAGVVAVLDRMNSFGARGPLFTEVCTALYGLESGPLAYNRLYGLGGRDMYVEDIEKIFIESEECLKAGRTEKVFDIIGVRGA